jgi:uncharacterized protein with HEPN domain
MGIDFQIVWRIIEKDLDKLAKDIAAVINN